MVSKKDISMVGFTIVAYAGDAKTALLNALKEAKAGNFDKAKELVKKSNQSIVDAHNAQTKLMAKEASGEDLDTTFIMSHGQDTLMTTMLLKDEINYFIDLYEEKYKLQKEVTALKNKVNN